MLNLSWTSESQEGVLMEVVDQDGGRVVDAVVFLEYFKALPHGRQSAKVKYPLEEVLLLCLMG